MEHTQFLSAMTSKKEQDSNTTDEIIIWYPLVFDTYIRDSALKIKAVVLVVTLAC